MLHLDKTVIVEGKYDKIKLSNILDTEIITTDGFAIFKDKQKTDLIRRAAEKSGIIIMTDSDSAGFLIRGHLKSIIPNDKITNVYIPEILGKEKRKVEPSKEGLLGVEGVSEQVILDALLRAGITVDGKETARKEKITKTDFYDLGLVGISGSEQKRDALKQSLNLPKHLSTNGLLTAINALYSKEEFLEFLRKEEQND